MRTFIVSLICIALFASCSSSRKAQAPSGTSQAPSTYSQQLSENAASISKDKAKKLRKDGWYEETAAPPIEYQLMRSMLIESAVDENGNPKYLAASARVLARTPANAVQASIEIAKLTIAGYIQSHIMGLVNSDLSNKQISMKEAESINKSISVYKNVIAQSLNLERPVAVFYRNVGNDRIEADVRLAYCPSEHIQSVRETVVTKLEQDTNLTREELDKIFRMDRFQNIAPITGTDANSGN